MTSVTPPVGSPSVPDRAREAAARGDGATIVSLLASRPLELWFGLAPVELFGILSGLPPEVLRRNRVAALVLNAFSAQRISGQLAVDAALVSDIEADAQLRAWYVFAQAGQARLSGDAASAFELMRGLPEVMTPMPHLIDASLGLRPFLLVQTALSAALAGHLTEALALYAKSLLAEPPPALTFFAREAWVRTALIHALYGDPQQALLALGHAEQVPRTASWVEPVLDVEERIVRSVLAPSDQQDHVLDGLLELSPAELGEMWPFYAAALRRVSVDTPRRDVGRSRIDALQAVGLGEGASGYAGSVIPLIRALDALADGKAAQARVHSDAADPGFWMTDMVRALHAGAMGSPSRVLAGAARMSAKTRGLLQADGWRRHLVAIGQFTGGHVDEALDSLRELVARRDPIDTGPIDDMAPGLVALAEARIEGWDARVRQTFRPVIPRLAAPVGAQSALTDRERDVLTCLIAGESRDQIARTLFLSVNTVKTHQRNLYRKLGVSDAAGAVRTAIARGLV